MTETRTISIIDLIVDVPGFIDLRAVADKLGYSIINGYDVLHIQHSSIHRNDAMDAMDIPHAGHSKACDQSPEACNGQRLASGVRYKRYFFLQAIVDGAFRIGDMENTDFRLDGSLVMVSSVSIKVQPDEVNRITLQPWGWPKETK